MPVAGLDLLNLVDNILALDDSAEDCVAYTVTGLVGIKEAVVGGVDKKLCGCAVRG